VLHQCMQKSMMYKSMEWSTEHAWLL
jgi:hypothetical protein